MEKQTIIFTALPNGRTDDGKLKLSVFIMPRLWSDDLAVGLLKLNQFGDFLDWSQRVKAATWKVVFEGGPTLKADPDPEGDLLEPNLWTALFKNETDVLPFRFDDFRGAVIQTPQSAQIEDFLSGVYVRAASNDGYGRGKDLPTIGTLADDPDIQDIARELKPLPTYVPPETQKTVDLHGTKPTPHPKPDPRGLSCCLAGCLLWPFALLARLFPKLKPFLEKLLGALSGSEPESDLVYPVEPIPAPPPPPPPLPQTPAVTPTPVPGAPPGPISANRAAFNELANFTSSWSENPVPEKLPTAEEIKDTFDFHQMIAALGDYPKMLRVFGLVVDLVVPLNGNAPPATGTVKIEPTIALTGQGPGPIAPRTHYELTADSFSAQPRPVDPEVSNGLLRCDDTKLFRVIQVDTVGGGNKIQNTATNVLARRLKEHRAPNIPDESGLPALRTGGISIVHLNLEAELRTRFDRSCALQQWVAGLDKAPQSPPPPEAGPTMPEPTDELFAEDLARGYRVDVSDSKSKGWHSLCQRLGKYNFLVAPDMPGGKATLDEVEDEGFVQFSAAEPLTRGETRILRAADSLFVWDGWSLCASRPGLSIMPQPDFPPPPAPPPDLELEKPKNDAQTNFKFETEFHAKPGSLPRLRFAYKYQLRVRVCDLAGNSVFTPADSVFRADVLEKTPEFPCARFEPVSPPAMMLLVKPVEGESLERMVVRSPPVPGVSPITERHIIPPKISQLMAEQHGKFDHGNPAAPTRNIMDSTPDGYKLAAREAGALNDAPAIQLKKPDPAPLEASDAWVQSDEQGTFTYLPDPASLGALLLGLPGLPADDTIVEPTLGNIVNKIPFAGDWPDMLPFRIQLFPIEEDAVPAEPQWIENKPEDGGSVLIVQLRKAEKRTVRLSSFSGDDELEKQGVLQWTRRAAPPEFDDLLKDTRAGRSWLQMPWRDLTLLHAVQRPLHEPTATVDNPADKQFGKTFATISGTLSTHAASTGKVDMLAQWEDPIDDVSQAKFILQPHSAHLCEVLIREEQDLADIVDCAKGEKPIHNFGDTKFHLVSYQPVGTTRFREYFPESITNDPANLMLAGPLSNPVKILNSVRPDAPRVLYVVPSYQWEEDPAPPANTVSRQRIGGLRVYLDRPWFSSGAGELLGVVFIEGKPFADLSEHEKPFVTEWGVDPMWRSGLAEDNASKDKFHGTTKKGGDLLLEEMTLPGIPRDDPAQPLVSVAGYSPEFDETRGLWFADILIDAGASYSPFVRLALARFQPHSVKNGDGDAHLSRIVRADFAQLAANRTASITSSATKASILVAGATYFESSLTRADFDFGKDAGRIGLAEIEALLQRRDPDLGNDPDLGWETLSTTLLVQQPGKAGEWAGDVSLTGFPPGPYRILLQEYEWYRADFASEEDQQNIQVARRIVYADAIPLS